MGVVAAVEWVAPKTAGDARGPNLFAKHDYYVNDDYRERVKTSMKARWAEGSAKSRASMERMLSVPSALWVSATRVEPGTHLPRTLPHTSLTLETHVRLPTDAATSPFCRRAASTP